MSARSFKLSSVHLKPWIIALSLKLNHKIVQRQKWWELLESFANGFTRYSRSMCLRMKQFVETFVQWNCVEWNAICFQFTYLIQQWESLFRHWASPFEHPYLVWLCSNSDLKCCSFENCRGTDWMNRSTQALLLFLSFVHIFRQISDEILNKKNQREPECRFY